MPQNGCGESKIGTVDETTYADRTEAVSSIESSDESVDVFNLRHTIANPYSDDTILMQKFRKAMKLPGSKKSQKEVNAECEKMESDLTERHARELAEHEQAKAEGAEPAEQKDEEKKKEDEKEEVKEDEDPDEPGTSSFYKTTKVSAKQAKRQAKMKATSEKMAAAAKADKAASENKNSNKHVEDYQLKQLLAEHNLQMVKIPGDGDCLYSAIADQLDRVGGYQYIDAKEVRGECYRFMKEHEDEFKNFVVFDDAEKNSGDSDWERYLKSVKNLAIDKGAWGGEPELTAISRAYNIPIVIYKSDGVQTVGEHITGSQPIHVAYLQCAFSLGAHYNSTKRKT